MIKALDRRLAAELDGFRRDGVYKNLLYIDGAQGPRVRMEGHGEVIVLSSNNYLGLGNLPDVVAAGHEGLDRYGFGMASVRFICGTHDQHRALERKLCALVGTEASLLCFCCLDANGGLFGTLFGADDAIVSAALNHASIIDGVRLCKAKCYRYVYNNLAELEARLVAANADGAGFMVIATDGVFSMDGVIAGLGSICDLAGKYDAVVVVDDSHAVGFIGETGRGTAEYFGVVERVDIITCTLGKALGGASGGFVSWTPAVFDLLRQRSRP
jgi:glycine C-acetyltransferase